MLKNNPSYEPPDLQQDQDKPLSLYLFLTGQMYAKSTYSKSKNLPPWA